MFKVYLFIYLFFSYFGSQESKQMEKGGNYYEFFYNTRMVKPTILHFQVCWLFHLVMHLVIFLRFEWLITFALTWLESWNMSVCKYICCLGCFLCYIINQMLWIVCGCTSCTLIFFVDIEKQQSCRRWIGFVLYYISNKSNTSMCPFSLDTTVLFLCIVCGLTKVGLHSLPKWFSSLI